MPDWEQIVHIRPPFHVVTMTFKHLSHCDSVIPAQNKLLFSVYGQGVTTCFTLSTVANHVPSRSKAVEVTGHGIGTQRRVDHTTQL